MSSIMSELGYRIRSHKIWVKTRKINLIRLTYSHIITFGEGKARGEKDFKYDVFFDPPEKDQDAQPASLIEKCIRNHTDVGDCVFDPFIGLGNTAIAAANSGRSFLGSEIDPCKHKISLQRLRDLGIPAVG